MHPAFDFTSELPLKLNPKKKEFEGALKKPSGAAPKIPSMPKGTAASGSKGKNKAPSKVSTKKLSISEK